MCITTGSKYLIARARTARTVSFLLAWWQLLCKPGILNDDGKWNFPAYLWETCGTEWERNLCGFIWNLGLACYSSITRGTLTDRDFFFKRDILGTHDCHLMLWLWCLCPGSSIWVVASTTYRTSFCSKHCARHFAHIVSLNPYRCSTRQTESFSFCRQGSKRRVVGYHV